MKYVVRKAFWDFEKEEKWLNDMSSKGMVLTDYSFWRYVFTEAPKNEYVYRIELLKYLPTDAESIAYIKFLEESGIECVAVYSRWVFLRKKSSEGPFDIYTDIDSKIGHYSRISLLWNTLMLIELIIGVFNLTIGIVNHYFGIGNFSVVNIIIGLSLTLLGLFFLKLGSPIRKKIKGLQQEKTVRE